MTRQLVGRSPQSEAARQERLMRAIERKYTPMIRAEIRRGMSDAVGMWQANGHVPALVEHEAAMQRLLISQAETAVKVFGARVLTAQKADALVIERKDFAATLAKLAARYVGLEAFRRKIVQISETTRNQIIAGVAAGFAEGLGIDGIGKAILARVSGISKDRANLIARTETHGAANYGAYGAAKETGLKLQKQWVTVEDERTRQSHRDADGQIVDMDAAFEVDGEYLMFPGDPSGSPGTVINCRCAQIHLVDDGI